MSEAEKVNIGQKIQQALARHLRMDAARVTPDALLREDLEMDSVDTIELLFHLEDAFHIEIPDDDLEKLKTVKDITSYVEARVGSTEGSKPQIQALTKPDKSRPARKKD